MTVSPRATQGEVEVLQWQPPSQARELDAAQAALAAVREGANNNTTDDTNDDSNNDNSNNDNNNDNNNNIELESTEIFETKRLVSILSEDASRIWKHCSWHFYSSSLLQTSFIVFFTFSSKTPKQVFFNPITIFDILYFTTLILLFL